MEAITALEQDATLRTAGDRATTFDVLALCSS